jgi:hypothetical protein
MRFPMKTRSAAVGILALALACLTAIPASASSTRVRPLRLDNYTVSVAAPPATTPPQQSGAACDKGSRLYCGNVAVTATFTGLNNRARPQTPAPSINLMGTIAVTRTYGCTSRWGGIVRRYDRTVRESVPLDTRRSSGARIPATGDTLTMTTYAFLLDSQPFNCPAGLVPVTTSIVVRDAKLTLDSYFESVPDALYDTPREASWFGVVPTPPKAIVP